MLAAASSTAEAADTLSPPGAGAFTTIHFVLIALLAVATIIAILVGMRKARERREAERRVEEEAVEAGVPPAPASPGPDALRDAPLDAHSLDRSAADFEPAPPAHDDLARPRPVAPGPAPTEPVAEEAPPARPIEDERIAAAAPMDASPAPPPAEPIAPSSQSAPSPVDGPVTQLKGLGPKVAARLAEMGVTTVGQIAALDADQAQDLDARLGPFAGRLHRDRWVEQARFLAAGDRAGFEAVFGRL